MKTNLSSRSFARLLPPAAALLGAVCLGGWFSWKEAPPGEGAASSLLSAAAEGGPPPGQTPRTPDSRDAVSAVPPAAAPGAAAGFAAVPTAALAPAAASPASAPQPWRLTADAMPRSHRQTEGHTTLRKPRRSARVEIAADWLAGAAAGAPVTFDLGAGLIARGEYVSVRAQPAEGVAVWAGVLHSPAGAFHLERNTRGWAGVFRLTDSTEDVQLMPDRFEPGVTRLEVWDKRATVCAGSDTDGDPETAPPADPSLDHTNLQSRPGAQNVIYLDFNGETVSGTVWNNLDNSFNDIVAAPSGMTRDEIVATWARAAEDWITFDVNVTTNRSVYNDKAWHSRAMVVCTPTKLWYTDGDGGIGGVAKHDSFNNLATSQICWSFNVGNYLECAETISHECGHMMGNSHSSKGNNIEYFEGFNTFESINWAPIMGNSMRRGVNGLTQFSKGEYSGANNDEDQIDEIEYELDPIPDTNSLIMPEWISMSGTSKKVKGLMNSGGDIDSYMVELAPGGWIASVEPNPHGANVDCLMSLRAFDNTLIERRDNTGNAEGSLSASLRVPVEGGLFRINIGSDASLNSPSYPEYSNYGGIGSYTLRIKRPPGFESSPPVLAAVKMSELRQGATQAEAEIRFRDASTFARFFALPPSIPVTLERIGGGVTVTGYPVSGSVYATDDSGEDTIHQARKTFRFSAPGGRWDAAEVGDYRVRIGAGAAMDEWHNSSVEPTALAGTLEPDTAPPVITAVVSPTHPADGTNDPVEVDITITDGSPITVTDNGINCFEAISAEGAPPITLYRFGTTSADGGRRLTMKCLAFAPATWNSDEVGKWNIQVRTGKVRDNLGNVTVPAVLGQFHVAASLHFQDFDVEGGTTGFTFDEGWAHGPPYGNGSAMGDPADPASGTRSIGYRPGAGRAGDYENNLPERFATSPLIDTSGHDGIVLRYRRWLRLQVGDGARIEVNDATGDDAWMVVWNAPSDRLHSDRGWTTHEIKLPSFVANGAVQVRWVMGATNAALTAGGWNIDDFEILSTGGWRPGGLVLGLPPFFAVQEGGATASYTVRLNQQPLSTVTVDLLDGADLSVSDTRLSFTTSDWSVARTVTVTATNDTIVEGTELTKIRHTCGSRDPAFAGVMKEANVGVVDNDATLLAAQPQDAAVLPGESATLRLAPAAGVTLTDIQWYEGLRGNRARAIEGADNPTLTVALDARTRGPQYYFARVAGAGRTEDTRQVTLSELTGRPAFHKRLMAMGYAASSFLDPAFDDLDPDKNGLTHFAEYALGLLPGDAPRWLLSVEAEPASGGGSGGTDLLVRLPELRPGVRYTLQSGPGDQAWTDVIELESDTLPEGPPVIRVPGQGSPRLLVRLVLESLP